MIQRVFLGWDEPFLGPAVTWLLDHRDELAQMLVVTPTAQSGRRLREAMAESAGALLAPKVVTPGSFLQLEEPSIARDWVDRVAWLEVLESVSHWADYRALFPENPGDAADWAGGLASEMVTLRRTLQENGLTIASASQALRETVEANRWDALGRLENLVEQKLRSWKFTSRSRALANGLSMPHSVTHIVLVGVTEFPPLLEGVWQEWEGNITSLIGAPESEAQHFSILGRPLVSWASRPMPWPAAANGSVRVTADPRQQAIEALQIVADAKTCSADLALGSGDAEAGAELARAFTREGWPAFHPAQATIPSGLSRWLGVWCQWLVEPTLAKVADLLCLPETGILISGKRAQKAKRLSELRDCWMLVRPEDLKRRVLEERIHREGEKVASEDLCAAVESLEKWRVDLRRDSFSPVFIRLLETLSHSGPITSDEAQPMIAWMHDATEMISHIGRDAPFWIKLMISEIPSTAPLPPEGRVIDVQGWLEIFHEPGSHLVLCGINEGKVPARSGGEPWLSESSREKLGLIKDADRAARDAFLYQAMVEARRTHGRVDIICGKSGSGGESLLPSRILLATELSNLPERVKTLFKEIEPPDAGIRWERDWQWKPRKVTGPKRLSVTSLTDYLACPFRYYLKHALQMRGTESDRREWNARDYGNVAHEVLENWGRDLTARSLDDADAVHDWLTHELDRTVTKWFDQRPPLSIRIQTEALRQRFVWFSKVQATLRADGWETVDVERKVEIPVGEALIVAKIDRIDRHRDSGRLRVIDYKTGKVDGVEKAHRRKITDTTILPAHFTKDDPVIYTGEEKGRTVDFRWQNLQLPLYAAAVNKREKLLPTPCYFTLGATESDVAFYEWSEFEMHDLEAAQACADWIVSQISQGVFWPPAEKIPYDDYAILLAKRSMEEMFQH
jgi:ATP-dependent helicase/nuclease subunit B